MVEMKRRSPLTSVATGRNSGADFWCVRWVRPRPWMAGRRASRARAGSGPGGRCSRRPGRRGSCGRCCRPSRRRGCAFPVHEGVRLVRVGRGRPRAQGVALAALVAHLDDPPRAAGDLGDRLVAEVVHDLVQGGADRGQQAEPADQVVADPDGLDRLHRVAVLVVHGARADVAVVVLVLLVQRGRERVAQEVEGRTRAG